MPQVASDAEVSPGLDDQLLRAALDLLAQEPAERISLRRVAQTVGVSHQAPYVHFGDKRRFLAAAAGMGLQRAAEQAAIAVSAAAPDPGARLHASRMRTSRSSVTGRMSTTWHTGRWSPKPTILACSKPRSRTGTCCTTRSPPANHLAPPRPTYCGGARPLGARFTESLDSPPYNRFRDPCQVNPIG